MKPDVSGSTLRKRTCGARRPAASAPFSAWRWQSQSSSSSRPASRAAANRRSGRSSAVPRGPRARASYPTTARVARSTTGWKPTSTAPSASTSASSTGRDAGGSVANGAWRGAEGPPAWKLVIMAGPNSTQGRGILTPRADPGPARTRHDDPARCIRAGGSVTVSIVETEDRGAVRHVVLNRPEKRNALNDELILGLRAAIEAAAEDDAVHCVVVRGAGPMFSSGMDFAGLGALAADPSRLRTFRRPILDTWNLLEEMTKPTIAQIHGACIGGSMELALACDLRTMAADAIIGMPETRVGLIPDVGGSSRLPAVVGLGRAKELVMASKLIDGVEAERIGLVNRVAPADDLDATTEQLVDELLACAPLAVGLAKRVMDASARPALAAT